MAKVLLNDTTLTAIADAIRAKTETSDTMLPGEMAAMIGAMGGGAECLWGEYTPAEGYVNTYTLGVALPPKSNHMFFIAHRSSTAFAYGCTTLAGTLVVDGKFVTGVAHEAPQNSSGYYKSYSTERIRIDDFSNGTFYSSDYLGTTRGHFWIYVGWD